jgi:cell wall-associated NlpC family hydrolase
MPSISVRAAGRTLIPAVLVSLLLCLAVTARAGAAVTLANWDAAQQRQVAGAHLMGPLGRSFQGASALSGAQANGAMAALAVRLQASAGVATLAAARPVHTGQSPVTVVTFDAMLVQQLGLGDVASHVQAVAGAAGLNPPAYFGSEVVARYLGLRYNHPTGTDGLELFPHDAITRAEAAWSLSQVLGFADWNVSSARDVLSGFSLPSMSGTQRQALSIAVSRIGYPYVWGGTTDDTSDGLVHGGFDCSGFAWRVYKVSGLPWGHAIHGRTAAQQAGEIPRGQRVPMSRLQPGDLLFFGSAHIGSVATEANIIHEGIYLGDDWVIHSSSQGVYVLPLSGSWLGDEFAWGRTVIH